MLSSAKRGWQMLLQGENSWPVANKRPLFIMYNAIRTPLELTRKQYISIDQFLTGIGLVKWISLKCKRRAIVFGLAAGLSL